MQQEGVATENNANSYRNFCIMLLTLNVSLNVHLINVSCNSKNSTEICSLNFMIWRGGGTHGIIIAYLKFHT
jgi:hypothetical protein